MWKKNVVNNLNSVDKSQWLPKYTLSFGMPMCIHFHFTAGNGEVLLDQYWHLYAIKVHEDGIDNIHPLYNKLHLSYYSVGRSAEKAKEPVLPYSPFLPLPLAEFSSSHRLCNKYSSPTASGRESGVGNWKKNRIMHFFIKNSFSSPTSRFPPLSHLKDGQQCGHTVNT